MKDKNVISKVLNIFMNVFIVVLGLVLLISIYNIIQVKVLKNDKSSFFGYSLFEVTSGSMSPEIEKGDWIIVKYKDDIEVGDIVTFKDEKKYITHRVVAKYNEVYTTRGDANNVNDDSIVKEQIVGVVVKILPCFGIFRATIFNPYVLIALIVTLYIVNLVFKKDQETSNKVIDNVIKNILIKIRKFINDKLLKNNKTKNVTNDVINNDSVSITQVNNDSINDKESLSTDQNYDFFADSSPISYESENSNNETIDVDENFDKTMYFRMVKVDKKDLDSPKIDEIDEVVETKEQDDLNIVNETEAEKNLEILYSKRKKFQNIIDKAMFMKGEELEELIDVLNENAKLTTNEATIREILIQNYIDGKYYNYCGNVNVEYDGRNINSRLSQAIDAFSNDLIDSYVSKGEYDHIFIATRMGDVKTGVEIPVNEWIGLGGIRYDDIGFSNIRLPNDMARTTMYKYDIMSDTFPEEVFVHEFLHTLERNLAEYEDQSSFPALHDSEKYGYSDKGTDGLKKWYKDYMRKEIRSGNTYVGLSDVVYSTMPFNKSDFNESQEVEFYKEPSNIFVGIFNIIKSLFNRSSENPAIGTVKEVVITE